MGSALLAGVLLGGIPGDPGAAARIHVVRGAPGSETRQELYTAIVQPSDEATTLLRRAREGSEREDWKLVIDSLQRIVDLPGEHVLAADENVYESARRHAHRKIAALPPAGLEAYRLMYDGEAAALLARARERHDPALLRIILEKYLISSVADEAALTLADWLMDEGRFSEAAATLHHVQSLYPDSDLPDWVMPARLATCAAGMGQRRRAKRMVDELARVRAEDERPGEPEGTHRFQTRLEQLETFVEQASLPDPEDPTAGWPTLYGNLRRDGQMHRVEPTFMEQMPWAVKLPAREPRPGFGAVSDYARRRSLLPTRHLVTNGDVMLIKGEREILALDADSFIPLWTSQAEWGDPQVSAEAEQVEVAITSALRRNEQVDPLDRDPTVRRLLYDSVGGQVSMAFGLGLTVEWSGEPPPPLDILPDGRMRQAIMFPGVVPNAPGDTTAFPNRVVAYSLEDGALAWMSQTGTATEDGEGRKGLGPVQFMSVPVPVDGLLVAPCLVNADLYMVALDPKTGRLVRHVYLCGLGSGVFDPLHALTPAVADGVIFVPTDRGLVLALETATWSIRWAVRYPTLHPGQLHTGDWEPCPVLAVSDVILLAPSDANQIFCFDRGTGELRWQTDRGDARYVLGATDTAVWLAGQHVREIDVETGEIAWTAEVDALTGRGTLSPERIYLPTVKGLVTLDARTGEAIDLAQPGSINPLGNLLAWDGSLYSVDISRVRRFPDLDRGYQEALARHESDPANPSRAIRLAWLELLKHRPAAALDALAHVPENLEERDARRHGQVVHLQVRAMLDLAASGEVPASEALALLQRARQIAIQPEDAIRTALALGDYYHRQKRSLDACLQYLSVALSEQGDRMISTEPGFEERARSLAVRLIGDAVKACSDGERESLEEHLHQRLHRAEDQRDLASLAWLAECPDLGDASHEASLRLGAWAAEDLRFEQAEVYLADVLRHGQAPPLIAEAAARLATIYLEPAELHQPVSASELLDRLAEEFPEVSLPGDILSPGSDFTSDGPAPELSPVSGRQMAATLRERLDPEILARNRAALSPAVLGPPGDPSADTHVGARPVTIRSERQEPWAATLLTLSDGKRLEARTADDGTLLWPAELRLLGESTFTDEPQRRHWQPNDDNRQVDPVTGAEAVADGQTLVINSAYGLHAIGLLTGRRLWARPFDPPARAGVDPVASDAWVWAHEGYVISVSAQGELEVGRINDGRRVLWRRDMPDQSWCYVRARGEYVVVVDETLEKANVFRLADGRYLGQCRFNQNARPGRRVNIALYDDVICGPVSDKEVVALELATPGAERWRVSLPDDLSQIFKPTPDLVAVSDRSGRVEVVDPATGRQQLGVNIYECEEGVVDGAIRDEVLYVCGYQVRQKASVPDEQRWALAAVRMEDERILWQRSGIGARAYLTADLLKAASNAIPIAVFTPVHTSARAREANRNDGQENAGVVELTIVDKLTGEAIGETASIQLSRDAGANRILDVSVWPDQVVVAAGARRLRFPIEPPASDHQADAIQGDATAGPGTSSRAKGPSDPWEKILQDGEPGPSGKERTSE